MYCYSSVTIHLITLKDLFEKTYLSDIIERQNIQKKDVLGILINILASSVGSYAKPSLL